jgi:hypothetical protein
MQQNTLVVLILATLCVLVWRQDGALWFCNSLTADMFSEWGIKQVAPSETEILNA